jgi:hypothetical protein
MKHPPALHLIAVLIRESKERLRECVLQWAEWHAENFPEVLPCNVLQTLYEFVTPVSLFRITSPTCIWELTSLPRRPLFVHILLLVHGPLNLHLGILV